MKNSLLLFILILFLSCATKKQEKPDETHQIVNSCLSFYKENIKFRGNYILDSFYSDNNKYLDWFYQYKSKSCSNYHQLFNFEKDSIFFTNQISNSDIKIDKSQINNKDIIFVTKSKIFLNDYIRDKLKKRKEELTEKDFEHHKKYILGQQIGGSLKLTKPVFSRDKKHALVFANEYVFGGSFWVLKKEDEKWEVKCVYHMLSH